MRIFETGQGPPLLIVPGLQGRWEYLRPAIGALGEAFHVITFPLCGEPGSGAPFEPARGLDALVEQIGAALDDRGLPRAAICGVSFGGLLALRFAARHADRTTALILVSAPGPVWHPRRRHALYIRAPRLLGPLFLLETPLRLRAEVRAAIPGTLARWRFAWRQTLTLLAAPVSLPRMAARARLMARTDATSECGRISAPTLIVTGEPGLDRVVRVQETLTYARLVSGARVVQLPRTGHLGLMTRPHLFARTLSDFVIGATAGDGGGPSPTADRRDEASDAA
jgi:pimeloyl-ACP methyl ester carboxylesterase